MTRLSDEWNCPKCGSAVVMEHRDVENEVLHVGTACGADWYNVTSDEIPEHHQAGWNHNSHTCSLILGLRAEKEGANVDRNLKADQLMATQLELIRVTNQRERCKRMLVAQGLRADLIDAALEES